MGGDEVGECRSRRSGRQLIAVGNQVEHLGGAVRSERRHGIVASGTEVDRRDVTSERASLGEQLQTDCGRSL